MIYQYVKRYLNTALDDAKIDFVWSKEDDIKFFDFIEQRYTKEDFVKEINEVKIAFKDFFEPVGNIVFRYKEDSGIKFKIFPYRIKPKDSKHLKNIIKIILSNKDKHIKYPSDDQIIIMGKIRREVNKEVFDTQESINVKELIEYAIRTALQLNTNDIITQLKRKYIVKIFNKDNILDVEKEVASSDTQTGETNKFNGYTTEQIQETYKEIFERTDVNIIYFLKSFMNNAFRGELNFKVINNQYFEAKVLKIIHKLITKELSNYVQLENDYLLGIASFLMRKHFAQIHELMTYALLEAIYEKDANANNFLMYFNGKTVVKNNKKYLIPSLKNINGQQWNNSSLIGICNLWMNIKKRKELAQNTISDIEMAEDEIEQRLSYIQPEKEAQEESIKNAQKQINALSPAHIELRSTLNHLQKTEPDSAKYKEQEEKLTHSRNQILQLEQSVKTAKQNLKELNNTHALAYPKLEALAKKKIKLTNDIKSFNLNLEAKDKQIEPIIQSITKALMQRTKLLS